MLQIKALLIFCEGSHDLAFIRLLLKELFGFSAYEELFRDYPFPFNRLFSTKVTQHAAKDLSLDMAHKFFLPDAVLTRDENFVLLFNSGGKNKCAETVKPFLSDFLMLAKAQEFSYGNVSVVTQAQYLFLFDADDYGVEKTLAKVKSDFAEIDENTWMSEEWTRTEGNCFSATSGNNHGIYVWGDSEYEGTLEDILIPLLEVDHKTSLNKASTAVDELFSWETAANDKQRAIAEKAKRYKATITLIGQRKKPGGSMHVIVDQAKLISKKALEDSTSVQGFVKFLTDFAHF